MQSLIKSKQKLFPMMCAVLVLFLSLMIPMKPVFAAEGFGGTSETVSNSFSYVEWGFYDIAFDGNGGSGSIQKISHIRFDETQTLPSNVFTRTGYTFNGWNTKADGTGSAYADKASVVRLTNENDAVVTMYAQWKANTYTVKYDANYASGESVPTISKTSDTVTFDSGYGTLPTASRTGYSFDGWYTDKTGGSKVESTTKVTTAKDHTLYAHWTAYHYNIAFNANGGSGSMAKQDVTYDKTAILTNNAYTRDGYQLLGWSLTSNGSVKYENQAAIRNLTDKNGATIQLYAVWTPATDVTKYATGEAATHTCSNYLASTYNASQHWQYCTVCGKKFNVQNHSYTEQVLYGTNSKTTCDPYNHFDRICSCGYSYRYSTSHRSDGVWHQTLPARHLHYQLCVDCGHWSASGWCTNSSGQKISCANPGTCATCGLVVTSNSHHLEWGKCVDCGKTFYTGGHVSTTYNGNTAIVVMRYTVQNGFAFTAAPPLNSSTYVTQCFSSYSSAMSVSGNVYTFTYTIYMDPARAQANVLYWADDYNCTVNGVQAYHCQTPSSGAVVISPDRAAPGINVAISDTSSKNGWSLGKIITITGTDAGGSRNGTVQILDSKGAVIASGSVVFNNGKYSITFRPSVEINGTATYTVKVTDVCNNTATKTFNLSNVDAKAPTITSGGLGSEWAKSKTYTLTATDLGSGNLTAQASGGSYESMTKNGTSYSKPYKYTGDIYGSVTIIYNVKDAAGNVATKNVTVSNLDNTAPHINKVSLSDLTVTVTADDINAKLGKSGSGIVQYGYINMDAGTSTSITWVSGNSFKVPVSGNYVIYAKDAVGNISNPYPVTVGASTVFNTN